MTDWTDFKLKGLFRYRGHVIRVIDGDTVEVRIDLGFDVYTNQKMRLYGIDAPEMRGEQKLAGRAAAAHLIGLVQEHSVNSGNDVLPEETLSELYVSTLKDKTGKYGRYLGYLIGYDKESRSFVNLNERMVSDGFAVEK